MEPDKQAIKENRLKLRLGIKKICIIEEPENGKKIWKIEAESKQPGEIRRRKKTCQDFTSFEFMSTFNDVVVQGGFQELFRLKNKIGEGAQSNVYQCVEIATDRQYAVKIAKKKDPELMQNMRQCYQVLKQLNHENIVSGKFIFLNEKKLTCHLVEECVKFPNLRQYMNQQFQECRTNKKQCSIDVKITANILKKVFNCLAYMAYRGVCHRDLKPDNILYEPKTGNLKIIDFGLARMQRYKHEKLTLLSQCGTLLYRAPQTFKGEYGFEVDTWAVGIIAFEMITGSLPFKSQFSKVAIKRILNAEPSLKKYGLSNHSNNFLKRLLDKNPSTRMTPKEALSSPFMLKNASSLTSLKEIQALKSHPVSEQSDDSDESELRACTPTGYYDEDMCFSFSETLNNDMGVRFCQD